MRARHEGEKQLSFGPYSRAGLALVFVPLYAGPILSGWAGHPLATLPVFALAFLLFIAASRRPDLSDPAGIAGLAIMAAVQFVLVAVCFGGGALVARFAGPLAAPLWLPIVMTALAAVVGALRYSENAEMNVFLDSAIEELEAMKDGRAADWAEVHPEPSPDVQAAVDKTVAALKGLPANANVAMIDPIVQDLEQQADVAGFDPFYDAAGIVDGVEDRRVDLGLLRFVASPYIRRKLVERGEGGIAPMLMLNASDPGVRSEARSLLATLIDEGAPNAQLPDPVWLDELNAEFPGEGYDEIARQRRDRKSA
ncbi:hypothetical protein [uncultured Maritimibacter sp.]|uniref:hypothetical protein n=1 Tax=uncultured Maritimibacter sp. TaxID=991866 RepID=UPI002598385A|nr:hypothetical protein [uncultured Maritimibacter sp.]